jgi:hypothetical protein
MKMAGTFLKLRPATCPNDGGYVGTIHGVSYDTLLRYET